MLGEPSPGNGEPFDANRNNPFAARILGQSVALVDSFTLESGSTLRNVPVAYKTWGKLSEGSDNALVVCHALTGSADVEDWWGPLIGPGRAFDTRAFFVVCFNVLGSPYGSASPVTINAGTGTCYGPEFPLVTVRDDVRIHRVVLETLGVRHVAAVVGGSLGGMQALEWGIVNADIVGHIIAIATSGRHSAWCISWGEAQRQAIFSDPNYDDGYYSMDNPPSSGLSTARMAALLTYRSRNSFELRFGRNVLQRSTPTSVVPAEESSSDTPPRRVFSPEEVAAEHHNEGQRNRTSSAANARGGFTKDGGGSGELDIQPQVFSAQSYLRYQGEKFIQRFDANCYVTLTRKLDSHDIGRGRPGSYEDVLRGIKQSVLIIGIESDALFTITEQYELAEHIPNARMVVINSPDGHDGFLLEFEQVERHVRQFFEDHMPYLFNSRQNSLPVGDADGPQLKKVSGSLHAAETEDGLCIW